MDYNNATIHPVIWKVTRPVAIDIHFSPGYIFWSDAVEQNIKRANIDGKNITIIHENTGCEGLAVEWKSMQLYWTDNTNNSISVSGLEGNNRRFLISSSLDGPSGIMLDPYHG